MKTRIKKIEYSDGRVEYIPQIKKFGYEISPWEQEIIKIELYLLLIPILNIFVIGGFLESLMWQRYNRERENEESARRVLDKALLEYEIIVKGNKKVRKTSTEYIKHP